MLVSMMPSFLNVLLSLLILTHLNTLAAGSSSSACIPNCTAPQAGLLLCHLKPTETVNCPALDITLNNSYSAPNQSINRTIEIVQQNNSVVRDRLKVTGAYREVYNHHQFRNIIYAVKASQNRKCNLSGWLYAANCYGTGVIHSFIENGMTSGSSRGGFSVLKGDFTNVHLKTLYSRVKMWYQQERRCTVDLDAKQLTLKSMSENRHAITLRREFSLCSGCEIDTKDKLSRIKTESPGDVASLSYHCRVSKAENTPKVNVNLTISDSELTGVETGTEIHRSHNITAKVTLSLTSLLKLRKLPISFLTIMRNNNSVIEATMIKNRLSVLRGAALTQPEKGDTLLHISQNKASNVSVNILTENIEDFMAGGKVTRKLEITGNSNSNISVILDDKDVDKLLITDIQLGNPGNPGSHISITITMNDVKDNFKVNMDYSGQSATASLAVCNRRSDAGHPSCYKISASGNYTRREVNNCCTMEFHTILNGKVSGGEAADTQFSTIQLPPAPALYTATQSPTAVTGSFLEEAASNVLPSESRAEFPETGRSMEEDKSNFFSSNNSPTLVSTGSSVVTLLVLILVVSLFVVRRRRRRTDSTSCADQSRIGVSRNGGASDRSSPMYEPMGSEDAASLIDNRTASPRQESSDRPPPCGDRAIPDSRHQISYPRNQRRYPHSQTTNWSYDNNTGDFRPDFPGVHGGVHRTPTISEHRSDTVEVSRPPSSCPSDIAPPVPPRHLPLISVARCPTSISQVGQSSFVGRNLEETLVEETYLRVRQETSGSSRKSNGILSNGRCRPPPALPVPVSSCSPQLSVTNRGSTSQSSSNSGSYDGTIYPSPD